MTATPPPELAAFLALPAHSLSRIYFEALQTKLVQLQTETADLQSKYTMVELKRVDIQSKYDEVLPAHEDLQSKVHKLELLLAPERRRDESSLDALKRLVPFRPFDMHAGGYDLERSRLRWLLQREGNRPGVRDGGQGLEGVR